MRRWFALLVLMASVPAAAADPAPRVLSAELETLAAEAQFGVDVPVIISFADRIDPHSFRMFEAPHERRYRMIAALKGQARDGTRTAMTAWLRARGATNIKPLWLANGVAATLPAALLNEVAKSPAVARVRVDAVVRAPTVSYDAGTVAEWNIEAVRAPDVWGLGYYGQGVTVAVMDTGVDGTHPDLRVQYRGGANSWFDAYGEHATPYDAAGHGTSVAGLILGRNGSGYVIGMAPDAQWIAARIFDDGGNSTLSAIHRAFEWLLDPDNDPATNDAPDIVNASWGLSGVTGCSNEFEPDLQALRAANIAVVFSAGNDGPGASSTVAPGNGAGVFSIGAVDMNEAVADFSSRGPSGCSGATDPELVAPGDPVFTADTTFGQGTASYRFQRGTSFAAPQVAGAMALLLSARTTLTVSDLETALRDAARDLGAAGADNDSGYGLLDAYAALGRVLSGEAPVPGADTATTAEDTPVTVDVLANDLDPHALPLALVSVAPTSAQRGAVTLNADNTVTYTPPLDFNGSDRFSYTVSNGGWSSVGTVTVTVTPVNDAPVAANDAAVATADAAGNFVLEAPGVLANDTDVDRDALSATLIANAAGGGVSLQPGGGFTYLPPASGVPAGPLTFTYRASDGFASSDPATVTFTLNHAPVARDDSYTLLPTAAGTVVLAAPGVLANDSDADGDAVSVTLVSDTAQGAVTLLPTGGFTWTPADPDNMRGRYQFTYRIDDGKTVGNVGTVTFTVNRAPVAVSDAVVLSAATASGPYTLAAPGLLANDADGDGDALRVELARAPATGTLTLGGDGGVAYTPPGGGVPGGVIDFEYTVSDGLSRSAAAAVRAQLNRAPYAADDDVLVTYDSRGWYRTAEGASVLANDSDADGNALTAVLVNGAGNGVTLTHNGGFTYRPSADGDATQPARFTYQVTDGHAVSRVATVTIRMPDPNAPVAAVSGIGTGSANNAGSYAPPAQAMDAGMPSTNARPVPESSADAETRDAAAPAREPLRRDDEDRLAAYDDDFALDEPDAKGRYAVAAPGVLANDRGGKITAVLVQNARAGKVTLAPDGGFVWTPPESGAPEGGTSFTYRVQQGTVSGGEATVNLVPRRPLAAKPDSFTLSARNARGEFVLEAPGVLANDSGPGELAAVQVQDAGAGSVVLARDGGFMYRPPSGGLPRGPVSFTYKAMSGGSTSRTATVVFTVQQPLAANADRFVLGAVDGAGRFVLPSPGVLANDSGAGTLAAKLVSDVKRGSVALDAAGGFVYTPPADGTPTGPLTFVYRVSDGSGSAQADVTFELRPPSKKTAAASPR